MDEHLEIKQRDIHEPKLNCIDLERNIWVSEGFPFNYDTGHVDEEVMDTMEGPPYVFMAAEVTLRDAKHPTGVKLENVNVIFMHGGRKSNGNWMFSSLDENGYKVVDTVQKVNDYLRTKGEPPIRVIMACNDYPTEDGIRVGDFPVWENIVYAVGETVGVVLDETYMDPNGQIFFSAKAKEFWNLDSMIEQLDIEEEIKIIS